MKNLSIAFIALLTILVSCKKDSDDKPGSSRAIRYEVSGNFSGTFIASYTTASGGTANDQVTLPWTKEINYASNVTAAIIAVTGNGGTAGQKVTLVIRKGGTQLGAPLEVTAKSNGSFSEAAPTIVF